MSNPLPELSLSVPWMGQVAYAGAMMLANLAAIKGFGYLEPSIGSLIGLAEILFGVFFGVMFFGENTSLAMIVGGVLIVVAAAIPSMVEMVRKQGP